MVTVDGRDTVGHSSIQLPLILRSRPFDHVDLGLVFSRVNKIIRCQNSTVLVILPFCIYLGEIAVARGIQMEDSTRIAASITFVFVDGSVVADKAEGNLSAKIARSAKSLGQSYLAQYYLKHLPLLLRTAANDHAGDHIIMTLMHGWMVWKGKVCTLDIFGTKQFVQVVAVTGHAHAEEEQQMDVDDTVVTYKIVDRLALIDKKEVEKKAHLYTHHIQFQPALIVHSPVSAVHASNDTSKGMQSVLYEISIRLSHRRMATSTMNVRYGTGVLLTGPSGCGKTHLLKQLGGNGPWPLLHTCTHSWFGLLAHTSMPILFMNCTSLFETTNPKEAIHRITTDILEMARLEANGCVLVMDNLDAILPFKMNESDGTTLSAFLKDELQAYLY